jgi:hypothetical protein
MSAVQLKQSELVSSIGTLTKTHESDIDGVLINFVAGCNSALASSSLTLHRKFRLTERGLRRIIAHADRTRGQLKREADRILRRRRTQ